MGRFNWEIFGQVLVGLMSTLVVCQGFTDPRDVAAINNLYGALGTPPLIGWVQAGGDPCTEGWQGVQCVNANITAIALNGANLGGVLGESLGVFASIIQIDLGNNHIGGIIPSNLPTTTRILSLSGNQFTGTIPETFSTLGQLTDMSLSNNHLTGVIPDTFQQLTGLINLDLSGNNLEGQLPPSLGNLLSLTKLHLQDNQLTGTLDVLQDLPLIDLDVENNLFSGPVPDKLLGIPNFRRAGNPFNTTVLSSPPASPPSAPPIGSPPSEQVPRIRPNEPSNPETSSSSKGENFLSKRIVWIVVAGLVIVIVVALGLCLCMSRCCKGRPVTKKVPKRHEMDVHDVPGEKPKHETSLLKTSHNENAQKDTEPKKEVAAAVPKRNEASAVPRRNEVAGVSKQNDVAEVARHRDEHEIDMPVSDEYILPPPPLPPLNNPFEKVIIRPNVPPVRSRKQSMEKLSSVRTFSIASLQQYTNSFSQENLLGGGKLGTVYRSELPDGKLLAVKKLDGAASKNQTDDDFLEFVSRVSELQHVNIVQLVGFCCEHGQRLLVYEYCGNGTVYEALHIDDEIHKNLSWNARVRLALQSARALEYLHEVCQPPIVHQNFTSANVLLDDGFAVRVSDCGLAPLISSNYVTQFQGSGYGAPELEMGNYTCQSDVYSFGVVMLELLTGRKAYDRSCPRGEQFLVRWAAPQLHDIDALSRMVDPSLKGTYPSKSLSRLADIISLCVQPEPEFRPPMSEIVEDLQHMVGRARTRDDI
ncbi:hypothetical protein DCAR_0104404 [Daucus carota subsp. sativus]|uniref:Protein kinase domain-containing protein n=1 Tax=Daucus carota subsp. sativus TaxID=79200 RepID=A0AAF1AM55_DAUCS|nr:PREDICTED: protein STRUBBELIG-RECEPTOR FAMILY 3-like [Daucus carota subsp. sativus]WOG85216.1 hypothetical protein DCAR_0104404 [Daucus carota subsp. sativus]